MIEIDRKTDIIALSAFVLALLSGASQLLAWTVGPQIAFVGPDRVALYADVAPNGDQIIRIAAPLTFVNSAQPAYSAVLVKETARMTIGDMTSFQIWNAFGQLGRGPSGSLTVKSTAIATPQPIAGQSAVSHMTLFTPIAVRCKPDDQGCRPVQDYVAPAQLADHIKPGAEIRFDFEGETFDHGVERYSCKILVSQSFAARFKRELSGYATCQP